MKRLVWVSLAGLTSVLVASAQEALVLHDATPIRLRLSRNLSSADAKVGETVDFEVLDDLVVDGALVAERGGTAIATVTQAQSKRRMARGGKLDVNIDYLRLADGDKVALRAVKETKGGGHTGAMTGGMVATAIVFFPAAPFFLFMHGKDVTIPKGTEITAYVNGEIKLSKEKFAAASPGAVTGGAPVTSQSPTPTATPAPPPARPVTASLVGRLSVTSQPDGADIEVNGKFVGNTPSTFDAPAGPVHVAVKRSGFVAWSRTIELSPGAAISLRAELERETPNIIRPQQSTGSR